jgi:hypothetical protein
MTFWSICMIAEEFPPVQVSAAQIEEMRKRVKRMPEYECEPYYGIACDPCLITTITIGDKILKDFCCGKMKKRYLKAFTDLASYLDEVAIGAQ